MSVIIVPPSYDALCLHWRQCTWVSCYWNQALQQEIHVAGIFIHMCVRYSILYEHIA